MSNHYDKISATAKLETLELYLRFHNTHRVGERLGISPRAVNDRLRALDVTLLPVGVHHMSVESVNPPGHIARIRRHLRAEIKLQAAHPVRTLSTGPITPAQVLETLELTEKLISPTLVGRQLGITRHAVVGRLRRLKISLPHRSEYGRLSLQDVNPPGHIAAIKQQLQAKIKAAS